MLPKKKSSTFFNPRYKNAGALKHWSPVTFLERTETKLNLTPKGQSLDSNPRVHAKFQVELDSPCRSQGKNPKQKNPMWLGCILFGIQAKASGQSGIHIPRCGL